MMAQFGSAGKNPPWARNDFPSGSGINQQMLTPGVATQAVYNLAAQQNLQTQFQAQQMAVATMQTMQQQAILPQPGIAMPTSLASPNMGTISYPALKTQQAQQQQQPKQRVFTGTVTKLHDNFGFVDEDVFFQTTCVKGSMPKVGDRVLVEAQYNANMPFKWNATCVKVLNYQPAGNNSSMASNTFAGSAMKSGYGNHSSKPPPLMEQNISRPDRNRSGNRDYGRDRQKRRDDRDRRDRSDRDRSKSKEKEVDRKRSRSPKRSLSPGSSKRSHSPSRRRPRIVPRYVVQVPKFSLDMKNANVVSLKSRYSNMYIPSDFFNSDFLWHEAFPLLRPFQLGKPCHFHVMHKDVERLGQNNTVLDPADADHLYNAKVMLIASPSLDDLYHKSCSLSQDPENIQENFVHPTRLINFLVGVKGKNEPVAIGGPWSPSLDGPNPADDPKVLIKTAIRTTRALTGINLSSCTQWYRYAEVHYLRPEETHKGKVVPARVETTVIFLPDVWSCQPTHLEWETVQLSFKKQLQKKLAQVEGKEDIQEEEEDVEEQIVEKTDPTHFLELDPKTMKIIELRKELECRNLSSKGLKSQLIARLTKVLKSEQEKEEQDAAEKPEETEETKEEESKDVEVSEEQKQKEEEEKTKEEERKKATLERRYTLPEKPSILVFPNPQAKGGKFDCSVMSLSVLLDYRPEDNKEHSFEVSLFAELFNEMLMRDCGFNIYKALCAAPEKPKEEKKEKEKEKKKDKEEEPAPKKKKIDEKEKKESDRKDSKDEEKDKKDLEDKRDDKKDEKKDKEDREKKDKDEKKEKKEKKKYMTVKPDLLLSCIYFDQNHTGYLLDKDVEELVHSIGLALSRAQVKKLIQKVLSRDTFNYRKLTDVGIGDEELTTDSMEVDINMDLTGNTDKLKRFIESPGKVKGSSRAKSEPLTGMVMHNGAMIDIDNVLDRLRKGEKLLEDFEKKVEELTQERDQTKKEMKKKEESYNKLSTDLKSVKHELSVQERITNSSESNNKRYLSVLMETQGLLNTLSGKVNSVLNEDSKSKLDKVIKKEVSTD